MVFEKYCASGNDFIIFTAFKKVDFSGLAVRLCDRFYGIGGDGLIVVLPSVKHDFEWLFYNSDGSLASMCGNGSRAAAAFAKNHGICGERCEFLTGAGVIRASIFADSDSAKTGASNSIKPTNFADSDSAKTAILTDTPHSPTAAPLNVKSPSKCAVEVVLTRPKLLNDAFLEDGFKWYFIDTGVPHLVVLAEDLEDFDLGLCGKMRQKYNANVNFAKFDASQNALFVRTFERGVEGETMACGTGMAASFLAHYLDKINKNAVKGAAKNGADLPLSSAPALTLIPRSGELLSVRLEGGEIYFKGEVSHTFSAII